MIADLKNSRLPEQKSLKKRLEFALTKKLGIIKQPYLLWPGDPKMNPPAQHILWAALITENQAATTLAIDILLQEEHEKQAVKPGSQQAPEEALVQLAIQELLDIPPENSLRSVLQGKIKKALAHCDLGDQA